MFERAIYKDSGNWGNIENPAASVKHDGANFHMQIGKDGSIRYFSRRQNVKGEFTERTSQLPQLTENKLPQYAGNVYNVELVHTGHSSQGKEDHPKLSGILNSLPEKSIKDQQEQGPVRAILLNVLKPKINTYAEKLEHMKEVEKAYGKPEILKSVQVKIGKDAVQDLIDDTKKMGKEGVIITSLTKPEDNNVRIKVKHVNTYNLKIKRINQEYDISGKPKESAGSVTVIDSTGKEVADVGTGFSRKLREEIWKNPKSWLEKEIQVKARTPSRHKLIAPVYNGDSDGMMDKVAESLQDKLLDNLVLKYRAKGVNMQKILDNPLFQQLPLDKKIAFIEQAGSPIADKPRFDLSNLATGAIGGGVAGAVATAMHGAMQGGFPPGARVPALLLGAGMGTILGGLGGAIRTVKDYSRDSSTAKSATSGISTLISRSGSSPIGGSPFGGNRYLTQLEGLVDTKVPVAAYFASGK